MASLTSTWTRDEYYVRRNTPFICPPSRFLSHTGSVPFHFLLLFLCNYESFSDFFFRRDRKKRSREDLYLRHRNTCHEAKSFDSVSCCMLLHFISIPIGRCPLKTFSIEFLKTLRVTRKI